MSGPGVLSAVCLRCVWDAWDQSAGILAGGQLALHPVMPLAHWLPAHIACAAEEIIKTGVTITPCKNMMSTMTLTIPVHDRCRASVVRE